MAQSEQNKHNPSTSSSSILNAVPQTAYIALLQEKQQQLNRIAANNPNLVNFSHINIIDGVANKDIIEALEHEAAAIGNDAGDYDQIDE